MGKSFRDDAVLAGRLAVTFEKSRSGLSEDAKNLSIVCVEASCNLLSRQALIPQLDDFIGVHDWADVQAHMHKM
jgi:hypothetical protein